MSSSPAQIAIKKIFARLNQVLKDAVDPINIVPVAQFTIDLIVKRARLGYGVSEDQGDKFQFPGLSSKYKKYRTKFPDLSDTTSPTKSNITLTGQLLDSVQIVTQRTGQIIISPVGVRRDGKLDNKVLAGYLAEKGRPFMYVSSLEYNQILRFYRKTFGDLLDKQTLLG